MSLTLIAALVIAVVVGLLRGGSLDSLSQTRVRWLVLLIEGLLVQLVFDIWDPPGLTNAGALAVLLIANLSVLAFLVLNRSLPGVLVIATGLLLNTCVITANQAMPVSAAAARRAGLEEPTEVRGDLKHELLDVETNIGFLGDVIPVPGLQEVLSIGDILLALGVARLVYMQTTLGPTKKESPRTDAASG